MIEKEILEMPKVELHCHLDGSLSREFLQKQLGRNVSQTEISVSEDCESLVEYLSKFDLPCSCLNSKEALEEAGFDLLKSMHAENVCYAEIRFAPLLLETETLSMREILESLLKGLSRGKEAFQIEYNVIVCTMRHHSYEENMRMIKVAYEFLGKGVCAADLAGAEAQYPMEEFMELFAEIREMGMPFTLHAGECGSVQNIIDSVEAGAKRIGHGIAMKGNKEVQRLIKDRNIGIEMCPISNLQTKAVKEKSQYPIREFLDEGILVSVNTDNRTVSNTTLTKELLFIQKEYGITDKELHLMMKNALKMSFAEEAVKEKIGKLLK